MGKQCDRCGQGFKGYGRSCGPCRRDAASGGSVRQCKMCLAFFKGFGGVCEDCVAQSSMASSNISVFTQASFLSGSTHATKKSFRTDYDIREDVPIEVRKCSVEFRGDSIAMRRRSAELKGDAIAVRRLSAELNGDAIAMRRIPAELNGDRRLSAELDGDVRIAVRKLSAELNGDSGHEEAITPAPAAGLVLEAIAEEVEEGLSSKASSYSAEAVNVCDKCGSLFLEGCCDCAAEPPRRVTSRPEGRLLPSHHKVEATQEEATKVAVAVSSGRQPGTDSWSTPFTGSTAEPQEDDFFSCQDDDNLDDEWAEDKICDTCGDLFDSYHDEDTCKACTAKRPAWADYWIALSEKRHDPQEKRASEWTVPSVKVVKSVTSSRESTMSTTTTQRSSGTPGTLSTGSTSGSGRLLLPKSKRPSVVRSEL